MVHTKPRGLPAMAFDRLGKALANESKYPFIIEVPLAKNRLDNHIDDEIVGFKRPHHLPPRFGAPLGESSTLLSLVLFRFGDGRASVEQFGGTFRKITGP